MALAVAQDGLGIVQFHILLPCTHEEFGPFGNLASCSRELDREGVRHILQVLLQLDVILEGAFPIETGLLHRDRSCSGAKDAGVPYILSKRFKNVRHSGARVGSVKNSWRIGGGTVRLLSETTQMARVGITAGIGLSASGGFGTYRGSCCPMIPDPFFQSCTSEN